MLATPLKKLEGAELITALKQQVEFYFSPQNLPTDVYLRSQMNARHFVPIDIIAGFRKIKALTEDRSVLIQAMKESKTLAVDTVKNMVGPNLKIERTTLILRDIPSSTHPDDIKKIFDDPNCGKVESIRPDVSDTWFVSFKDQEACTSTAMYLVGKKFKGKPIHCRVKSENPFRTLFWPSLKNNAAGAGRGVWKPGQGPPPIPPPGPAMFYGQKAGLPGYPPPYGQFPPMVGPHQPGLSPPVDRYRKSKRGKQKNTVYRGKQKQNDHHNSQDSDTSRSIQSGNNSKKVYIKYQQPCLKYTREQMAEIVKRFSKEGFSKPKTFAKSGTSPVIADKPASDSQLLEPMPVMYPASPSPLFAAQPHHSSMPPFLDLATTPSNTSRGSAILPNRQDEKGKKGRSRKTGQKKYAKKPSKPKQRKGKPKPKSKKTKASTNSNNSNNSTFAPIPVY